MVLRLCTDLELIVSRFEEHFLPNFRKRAQWERSSRSAYAKIRHMQTKDLRLWQKQDFHFS